MRLGIFGLIVGLTLQGRAEDPRVDDEDRETKKRDAVTLIQAAIASTLSSYPVDFLVQSSVTDSFDDEPVAYSTTQFRLRIDLEKEEFLWCGMEKKEQLPSTNTDHQDFPPKYFGVKVVGNKIIRYALLGKPIQIADSFKGGLRATRIPLPQHWGVMNFPYFGDPYLELARLKKILLSERTSLRIADEGELIRIVARTHEEGEDSTQVFDVFTWLVSADDYRVRSYTLDRSLHGKPIRYWEQTISYKGSSPVLILSETKIVRKIGDAFQVGSRNFDTEIRAVDRPSNELNLQETLSLEEILANID